MKNISIYKQLFKINRLSAKRDPNYSTNKVFKIVGYITAALLFIFLLSITILMLLNSSTVHEDIEPIFNLINYSIGGMLVYELFFRLLMLLNKPPVNPFAFYILPIPKKKIILFRQLYTAVGKIGLTMAIFLLPMLSLVAYTYNGLSGVFSSFLLLILCLIINKQVYDFATIAFKRYKALTTLILGCYVFLLLSPIIFSNNAYFERAILYTIVPYHSYFTLNLLILLASAISFMWLNNKLMRKQSLDDIESDSSSISKLKFLDTFTVKLGSIGIAIKNDLKLILRTKQVKIGLLVIIIMIVVLPFIGSKSNKTAQDYITSSIAYMSFFFMALPMSILPYETFHYNFLFSKKWSIKDSLWSRWILNLIVMFISFIPLTIFFIFKGFSLLPLIALFFYGNVIISGIIGFVFSAYNTISINPYKKSRNTGTFNGVTTVFYFILPLVSILCFSFFTFLLGDIFYYIVILLTILLLIMFPTIIKATEKLIIRRKHIILEKIKNN